MNLLEQAEGDHAALLAEVFRLRRQVAAVEALADQLDGKWVATPWTRDAARYIRAALATGDRS